MKKCIIIATTLVLCLSSYVQARDISPTFSIRYEDFINSANPSAAIGLKLDIDGDRYTGFQVNSDGTDTRLLVGWNWGVIGIGSLTSDNVSYAAKISISFPTLTGLVATITLSNTFR